MKKLLVVVAAAALFSAPAFAGSAGGAGGAGNPIPGVTVSKPVGGGGLGGMGGNWLTSLFASFQYLTGYGFYF